MIATLIEATNSSNYGKFEITVPDEAEYEMLSAVDGRPLYWRLGWSRLWFKLFDLETGQGAYFHQDGLAQADLEKAKIRVCFVYPLLLEWLYAHPMGGDPDGWVRSLPRLLHFPETLKELREQLAAENRPPDAETGAELGDAPALEVTP